MKVAVIGATGGVGTVILNLLDKRKFPVGVISINDIARYIAENR